MKTKNILSKYIFTGLLSVMLLTGSCKKAINIGPSLVSLNNSNVYTSDAGAQSVVAGILTKMAASSSFINGTSSISLNLGLACDELRNLNPSQQLFSLYYTNSHTTAVPPGFWTEFYKELLYCNSGINGITASAQITPPVKEQLIGELKFLRAFIYFYATNLYGDIPLAITEDYHVNNVIGNSPQADVYIQIIKDLLDAKSSLSDNAYVTGYGTVTTDRLRPNKQAASALLARVYLFLKDWKDAEAESSSVISSSLYIIEPNLNQVFLKTSKEAILQLQPVVSLYNCMDAPYLVVSANPAANVMLPLNNSMVGQFTASDKRLANWIGKYTVAASGTNPAITYYYAYKYKINVQQSIAPTEYPMILRLAEQYLIRAEARAQQGNLTGAADDLNVVRRRAGLPETKATAKEDLLNAILTERQLELFTEWGHRWFDLKRLNKLNDIMTAVEPSKGGIWSSYKQLFPIPASDILADPNIKQNPGYTN